MSRRSPCIIGIDPGLNVTGYAVLALHSDDAVPERAENSRATPTSRQSPADGPHARAGPWMIEAGIIRSQREAELPERLAHLHQGLAELLNDFHPLALALEQLYSHYQRPRTAILMGHARGVLCLAAAQAQVPVQHYSATQVKKILTGSGRATKGQVQRAIQRELALPQFPEPPDVADALAIALCHYYLGHAQQGARPQKAG